MGLTSFIVNFKKFKMGFSFFFLFKEVKVVEDNVDQCVAAGGQRKVYYTIHIVLRVYVRKVLDQMVMVSFMMVPCSVLGNHLSHHHRQPHAFYT